MIAVRISGWRWRYNIIRAKERETLKNQKRKGGKRWKILVRERVGE
jgi:hypothetical protein